MASAQLKTTLAEIWYSPLSEFPTSHSARFTDDCTILVDETMYSPPKYLEFAKGQRAHLNEDMKPTIKVSYESAKATAVSTEVNCTTKGGHPVKIEMIIYARVNDEGKLSEWREVMKAH